MKFKSWLKYFAHLPRRMRSLSPTGLYEDLLSFSSLKQKNFPDNPNPNAKIAFVIFYPFQFHALKNIYKHLASESEFIIDATAFHPAIQPLSLIAKMVELLSGAGVYYRVVTHDKFFFLDSRDFFYNYKIIAALWFKGCVNWRCNNKARKVTACYGGGKELTMFRFSQRLWDLILNFGIYDNQLLRFYTNTEIVGNPKFDDWFNNEIDKNALNEVSKKIDGGKKTILYLPTHSDLSSIDYLAPVFGKLARRYNILTKLHYYTIWEEPKRVAKLSALNGILIFDDAFDLLPLLKVCDLVISDNSSAIFDAILADKPVIAADLWSDSYLDLDHKIPHALRNRLARAVTYSQSIEQKIKKEGKIKVIKKPENMDEKFIEETLKEDDYYKAFRKEIRDLVFAFNDGRCGLRAAQAIKNLAQLENLPPKPVLYHVIEKEMDDYYLKIRRPISFRY